ncbi:MAG: type II secretion system secretin GspD [Thermodesulfobacteriota bacterium]
MRKKTMMRNTLWVVAVLICCFGLLAMPPSPRAAEEVKEVALDFDDVDIRLFIRVISELTGKNFTIDNNVRGKVTVLSPRKLTTEQAFEVFKSVLNVNGFTVVESGPVTKIVPAQNMSGYELPLSTSKVLRGEDQFITQIMPLRYLDANALIPLIKPLLSRQAGVFAPPSSDILVVTDYKSNIRKVDKLLDEIDVEIADAAVEKLDLKHSASEVVSAKLTEILDAKYGKSRKGARPLFFKVVPIERTNAVVGIASADILMDMRSILNKIDVPTPEGKSLINVYYLEHAKAEDMVKILTETQRGRTGMDLTRGMTTAVPTAATAPRAGAPTEAVPRTEAGGAVVGGRMRMMGKEITISADKGTNSVIVYAEPDDYNYIKEMLQRLDIPRKQVFIEALILEVSPNESFQFGSQWSGMKDVGHPITDQARTGVVVGSQNTLGGLFATDAQGATTTTVALGQGFSLGMLGENISIGGFTFPSLNLLIKAMETLDTVDILSKPQLMTLNNERAAINISTNIPYQTTSTIVAASGQSQQSFEYRDVGIKLEITPRINKNKKVTLEIKQEVSKLADTAATLTPRTFKRTIDTVVEVQDGGNIVIGGLIEEQKNYSTGAVPCLGGIPFFGWAFKNIGISNQKSNLLVFISPKVFESSAEAEGLTKEKKEYMDGERTRTQQEIEREKPFFMEYDPKRKQQQPAEKESGGKK